MANRGEKIASAAIAATVNCLLFLFLYRVSGVESPIAVDDNRPRLRIQWTRRAVENPAQHPAPTTRRTDRIRSMPATRSADDDASPRHDDAIPIVADDDWNKPARTTDGFSDDDALRQRLAKRQGTDALAAKRYLPNVRFQDSSFGGKLQRMAQRRQCGELRSALQQRPESTDSVLEAMQRLGCRA